MEQACCPNINEHYSNTFARSGGSALVLFVDDEKRILDSFSRATRREGYQVLVAKSALEALQILSKTVVDVMVCDELMPGMCGSQLLSIVRSRYPQVIRFMLSGKADLKTVIDGLDQGTVDRFFMKPCNWDKLRLALQEALMGRKSEQGLKVNTCVRYENHGLGLYRGLKHIHSGGVVGEFLCIDFGASTYVYVPIEQRWKVKCIFNTQ